MTSDNVLAARCSCWWTDTAVHEGRRIGAIGHYAAADPQSGVAVLSRACDAIRSKGCTVAVGPMDGNTWRPYRFIVDRGDELPFFLEPDNPDEWPEHWTAAGFATLATYTSAVNDRLDQEDERAAASRAQLIDAGITIRPMDPSRADDELRRIYALSLAAFSRNFLYTPLSEDEFLAQNRALLPFVRPELVLLAEREEALVGYLFAVPDALQARRGATIDTVIIKTLAVDPAMGGMGIGGVLVDVAQQTARDLGFRRAIHALMHETNLSRRISGRYGRTFRRYALFARSLAA